VPIVLKYGSINLLEPYGPGKACNGIAFCCLVQGDVLDKTTEGCVSICVCIASLEVVLLLGSTFRDGSGVPFTKR
jgi:hypothetical protein